MLRLANNMLKLSGHFHNLKMNLNNYQKLTRNRLLSTLWILELNNLHLNTSLTESNNVLSIPNLLRKHPTTFPY